MSELNGPGRLVVGQLAGVFGVKGWVKVKSYTQPIENILDYGPWRLLTQHGMLEMEVDEYKIRPQGLIVHFRGLDDRDVAAQYGRAKIEVDKALLPELEDGDFYWHQLFGLKVISDYDGETLLGIVDDLMETGANDVLVVKPCVGSVDDRERLVPYVLGQYVTGVDLLGGEVRVIWDPEF